MKYAFKMMAVVLLTFGMSGCAEYLIAEAVLATVNSIEDSTKKSTNSHKTDAQLCHTIANDYTYLKTREHKDEAILRGLDCKTGKRNQALLKPKIYSSSKTKHNSKYSLKSNAEVCNNISSNNSYIETREHKDEAILRGLDCAVGNNKNNGLASNQNNKPSNKQLIARPFNYRVTCSLDKNYARSKSDETVCFCSNIDAEFYAYYSMEKNRRQIACNNNTNTKDSDKIIAETKSEIQTYIKPKPTISSAELDASKSEANALRIKLATLQSKQKQEQQRINTDNQIPTISAFTKLNGPNATISGRVTDNTEIAEVLIDGETITLKNNGTFKTELYIPRNGLNVEIVAYDRKGNKASKALKIERGNIQQANVQKFKSLNPSLKTVKSNPNALALIIGISDYENTKASALYADSDAKTFYDYANMKLGIPSSNIKELINDGADRIDITRAIKTWLLKRTVTNKTDIYVFFAGHGLATDDGKGMYLLPYDGVPDLLEDSAIQRKELFADIQATKPRSVTVFLDTCYSGGTRNEEETLVASLRPIIITAKQQSIPNNFTVLSAAKGNQTSQSLEEAKHGLFSYYMMLGMEGGADLDADKKITARELHEYVVDKVERQSQFRQTPELQGDKDKVLVRFN